MEGCEFIRVVTKEEEECFLLTKLLAKGKEGFELTVFNDGKVWSGKVTGDDLEELASRLKIPYSQYVEQTRDALTSLGSGRPAPAHPPTHTFNYQLRQNGGQAEFSWKKHVPAENITFQLGAATLKSRADSALYITRMFEHCVLGMEELKERIRNLETDNERLAQERLNALKRLEKCVVAKEELEQELYSKFTMVLNSKKEKIRQLKQGVNNLMSNEDDSDGEEPLASTSRTKRSRSPEDNDNAGKSESEVDTDEETRKPKKSRVSQRAPRDLRSDESLDLGHDEEVEDVSQLPRTRRQRGRQQKKQTPSKPVLPRVGSNEASLGSEKKPKLRKRGSSNSTRSSDNNIDADDLMGEL